MSERHVDQPLMRLVELYVLWSIGEISDEQKGILERVTPRLQSAFSAEGTWQEVIATVMRFPPDMPETLRVMWRRNTEIARQNNVDLPAQRFAEMFVDDNFEW